MPTDYIIVADTSSSMASEGSTGIKELNGSLSVGSLSLEANTSNDNGKGVSGYGFSNPDEDIYLKHTDGKYYKVYMAVNTTEKGVGSIRQKYYAYYIADDGLYYCIQNHAVNYTGRTYAEWKAWVDSGKNESYDVEVNESLALGYVDAFKLLSKSLKIKNDLTASFLVKVPDVVKLKKRELDETEIENAVLAVLDKAIDSYDSMRNTEGAKLREDVEKNLDIILETVERIEELAPLSVEIYKNRLAAKMKDALEGKEYDEQRLITEVAIFADKVDVGEETVRLKSHISQFKELMDSDSPSIGKKLDFIVQEMNREINTTGSKCNSVEITKLVVDTKSVIEKIREQIQNIE
jgi:uncharacterized protein (TIGR00255 family)